MSYHRRFIQSVEAKLDLNPLKQIASQPSVYTAFRIVAYYVDGRAYHSASTLTCKTIDSMATLDIQYLGFLNNHCIQVQIGKDSLEHFMKVIHNIRFDTLRYPENKLLNAPTLWNIQQVVGTFQHDVTLNPHDEEKPYCYLINAIDGYLSDAVREITQ